jgi:glyoxylase I family protein
MLSDALNRRNILYFLACASGWPVVGWSAASRKAAEEEATRSVDLENPGTPSHPESSSDTSLPAERVLGIGGLFFRARDPKSLAEWYRSHLGVTPTPTSYGEQSWHTQAGTTVFAPFSLTTKYFGDEHQMWMVNFRVRDLEKMAAQLRAAGVTVTVDPEHYPNGRFARIHDPEGNPIELWEPAEQDALPK